MTEFSAQDHAQRRTLLVVLILNALLFVGLGVGGLLADSSALLANAADNASDSVVYLLSFLAVGRGFLWKQRAARLSGILLLVFAGAVILDVGRRWLFGAEPFGVTMMAMALVAAAINLLCLVLIRRAQSDDVNMRAAETFSFNDFASNGGILVAGGLVMWLDQAWPDLVVGVVVAIIAVKGGLEILEDAKADET
ncbi:MULTISPECIES: cation transporter [unclassified Phenylobacterium]|jgi:cobalt-zinc-cadmium efflux system protein|uniref:cation transporter n=1 Tax=unclassified Phenylobacterium TaxID=2640670 RepID=UPI0008CADD77|nr:MULTISPECIES: cation transporter [unclassified Phenylobacterium]MCR5880085.1 cation transporter [Phenylobacterium sp. J367]OHB26683.1 MAG: RND transporter [Phenylobacterium sp. RIFCSPHIGHO2_01_FULL_69_31]